ncbi:FAD-dependent monooxygenase [Dactylosporangium sp. CA-139066]|uniref:FAD-dependent monooxygenase n=1 Tax=Dactylosporangium sp. CA-139066 TaxID=3239930 RepID=UPI003D93FF98
MSPLLTSPVAIAGGGIGGLTAALGFLAAGVPCTVLERRPSLPSGGFGIQLPPNATRILFSMGLGPALDKASVRPVAREIRRWSDGALLGRLPLGEEAEARYGAPYLTLRRADLLRILLGALPPGVVRFGSPVDLALRPPGLLVGADGLHSAVRAALSADEPRFIGYTAYRALLPGDGLAPVVTVWLGPGRHVVTYPVPGARNVVLVTAGPLEGVFDDWHDPVRSLARAAAPAMQHALFTRDRLPAWHRGRLVILGDAAHPMPPFLAQGAAQAVEDAAALVAAGPDLAAYEAARRPRAERVAAASAVGAHDYHLPDGPAQRRRDERIAASGLPDQDWLFA